MKVALVSNEVTRDFKANQKRILKLASEAADRGAELIIFPEAAATGLVNTGDPKYDLGVVESEPDSCNMEWGNFASERGILRGQVLALYRNIPKS
ncbi:carbon-nitrogen hydrolase family protein [candidate division WOR-3 bacterium]|nr:carbon-nitrogen hydrolase family protein [candidate division WOR-3 bacterium]